MGPIKVLKKVGVGLGSKEKLSMEEEAQEGYLRTMLWAAGDKFAAVTTAIESAGQMLVGNEVGTAFVEGFAPLAEEVLASFGVPRMIAKPVAKVLAKGIGFVVGAFLFKKIAKMAQALAGFFADQFPWISGMIKGPLSLAFVALALVACMILFGKLTKYLKRRRREKLQRETVVGAVKAKVLEVAAPVVEVVQSSPSQQPPQEEEEEGLTIGLGSIAAAIAAVMALGYLIRRKRRRV